MRRNLTQLWDLLEPVIAGLGYELVEIEYQPNPKHGVLRVYIDQERGIALEDCKQVSDQVSALLDVEDPVPGHYNLEVSSPGLDRPLRTIEDFERFTGEIARIRLGMPISGQRNFKGRLAGVEDDAVRLDCEGGQVTLPLASIDKARLAPDFDIKNDLN
jgi:ribosome maturation factor RimP